MGVHRNYRESGDADGVAVDRQLLGRAPAGSATYPIPAFIDPAAPVRTFAISLPESAFAILRLVAAHDRVSESALLTRLVCQHAERIGISALGDLSAVPDFERAAVNRSTRGGPG